MFDFPNKIENISQFVNSMSKKVHISKNVEFDLSDNAMIENFLAFYLVLKNFKWGVRFIQKLSQACHL